MIQIQAIGDPEKLLAGLGAGLEREAEVALDKSAAAILNRLRTTYMQEQDPTGSPWIPSKAGQRNKAKGTGQTMYDTGRLFRSIQLSRSEPGLRAIGTNVPYAQEQRVKREFLAITPEHVKMAESVFSYQLNKLMETFK